MLPVHLQPSSTHNLPTATCAAGGQTPLRHDTLLVHAGEVTPMDTAMPPEKGLHLGCYHTRGARDAHPPETLKGLRPSTPGTVPLPARYPEVPSLRAWRAADSIPHRESNGGATRHTRNPASLVPQGSFPCVARHRGVRHRGSIVCRRGGAGGHSAAPLDGVLPSGTPHVARTWRSRGHAV